MLQIMMCLNFLCKVSNHGYDLCEYQINCVASEWQTSKVNPLCMLHNIPTSVPETLTKARFDIHIWHHE